MSTSMDNFEQHLMQKYPDLFYKNNSGELECPCGVWVPPGWEKIVDNLCGSIYSYIYKTKKYSEGKYTSPPEIKIDQIKEKFAGLRFYYSGGDDQISGMVYLAEYICEKTCEVTGEPGVLCNRAAWYKTLSLDILDQPPYNGYKPVDKR